MNIVKFHLYKVYRENILQNIEAKLIYLNHRSIYNKMKTPDEKKKTRKKLPVLEKRYTSQEDIMEIGVDEAGRGPMLGRVYSAAVVLPNNDVNFKYELMKDSKKFTSKKKIT